MKKISFNRDWNFMLDTGGGPAFLRGGEEKGTPVDLPHDAEICFPRNPDEPDGSGNGYYHAQNVTYTKNFTVDPADRDKNIWLEFEGVYQNAYVYVNNAFAGMHPYGYGNYYLDITRLVRPGEENRIKVAVKNGVPSGRWYTGGGIYRDVHLMIADRLHIVPDGVQLSTAELDGEMARVRVETELEYKGLGIKNPELTVELFRADGSLAACDTMSFTIGEGEKETYRQWLTVMDPMTWDAEHPYLYSYRASLKEQGTVIDTEEGSFGIRKIRLDAEHGLRINGKTVKLIGGCLHHDCGVTGTAEFAHAEEVRVLNLKKAGFNAIRSSHYPASRRLIEACDKYGLYVMDEFTDVWTSSKVAFDYSTQISKWWEYDLGNMVRKDYNHPSVILYSIGNEIPETGNPHDVQWGKKFTDLLHKLDDGRFVINCMNLMFSVMDRIPQILSRIAADNGIDLSKARSFEDINDLMSRLGDAMALVSTSEEVTAATAEASGQTDITGYNYCAARYMMDHETYPNRVMCGSETNPGDLDVNWELVEKLPYVIGDFDWTAYDYLGEAGIGKVTYGDTPSAPGSFYAPYPTKSADCGDIDLLGNLKPAAYWRATVLGKRTDPYIAVQDPAHFGKKVNKTQWKLTDAERSWTFRGKEEMPVHVEVYASAEEVELFVNGESCGRAAVGEKKKNMAFFDTVYRPGIVEAAAYTAGTETGRDRIDTAGDDLRLNAEADVVSIPADGSDIGYVEITVTDGRGTIDPEASVPVSISIEGPGMILGYGSADPESEENYFDMTAKPFRGRLRAAVRATGERGTVKVTLSSPGLRSVSSQIESV